MMKRHRVALAAFGALTLAALAGSLSLVACSSSEGEAVLEPEDGASPEGAADAPFEDADAPSDGGLDAEDAADADGGDAMQPPRCTADGWCHTVLPPDAGTISLTDVWANQDEAWAVTKEGRILHAQNDQWAFTFDAGVALTGVRRDHEGSVWAVGKAGSIFRHAAGAPLSDWAPVQSGTGMDFVAICEGSTDATTPQNIWVAGQQTLLLHWTGQGGESPLWSYNPIGPIEIRSLWCSNQDVWAVGLDFTNYGTALYHSSNSVDWTKLTGLPASSFARPFSAVWATSESDVWMADITKIAHGPGGAPPSWATYDIGDWYFGSPTDWDFWGSGPNDVWIVGRHGRIYHWDGADLKLSITSIDGVILPNNLHGISGTSASGLWVVGDDVALHRKAQN